MKGNPRETAYHLLRRVEGGAFVSFLLASRRLDALDPRDRRLVQELVLGVLRQQSRLDYEIDRLLSDRSRPADIRVRTLLRLGLYQLRFLDRVPPHAAVNETVNLARSVGVERSAGLINAVLRRALTEGDSEAMEEIGHPVDRLSIRYSHPKWLVARWVDRLGPERAEAILLADNQIPPVFFFLPGRNKSANETLRSIRDAGLRVEPADPPADCWRLVGSDGHGFQPFLQRGVVHVLDRASQWVASLVEARPEMRVLDLCAAPGGKTVILAERQEQRGAIFVNDLHLARMRRLIVTCRVAGVNTIRPLIADLSFGAPFLPGVTFDRVLVDAPCSGTGTLRRNPDLRWRICQTELEKLTRLQARLLSAAAPLVARGGRLVYSTCSMEPEENEGVVETFLGLHTDFDLAVPETPGEYLRGRYFSTDPTMEGMDGHFAAVMRRR